MSRRTARHEECGPYLDTVPAMKKLHRMIIGAYWGPLLITFLIVLFILVHAVPVEVRGRPDGQGPCLVRSCRA